MITKEQAMTLGMFYHVTARNADGTAVRCRANGRCKTWKTRPDDFRLPVKYGLKRCFYLTPRNADEWLPYDPSEKRRREEQEAMSVGLSPGTPREVVMDKMEEQGVLMENCKSCGRRNRREDLADPDGERLCTGCCILKQKVQKSVPRVWQEICYDASELEGGCSLEDAVELCLDANRPVWTGRSPEAHGMTAEEYAALCHLDKDMVDGWAREVLRGYF